MSSSDFREILLKGDAQKAERLFRAAVTAFCSLTRPSRRDAAQLDDLTQPLFDLVSVESRRYVAAALSECALAPHGLIKRLCEETVDIAAPLLLRSRALGDADLIGLISRQGISHARIIGRRPSLTPSILHLIQIMESMAGSSELMVAETADPVDPPEAEIVIEDAELDAPMHGEAAERVRDRLRNLMEAQAEFDPMHAPAPACYAKLRDAALTGEPILFQTALGDVLKLNRFAVRAVTEIDSDSSLLAALRSLDLSEEQAYLVASAAVPKLFSHPESIRLFLSRFRELTQEIARERVRGWQLEMVALWVQEKGSRRVQPDRTYLGSETFDPGVLKAS